MHTRHNEKNLLEPQSKIAKSNVVEWPLLCLAIHGQQKGLCTNIHTH